MHDCNFCDSSQCYTMFTSFQDFNLEGYSGLTDNLIDSYVQYFDIFLRFGGSIMFDDCQTTCIRYKSSIPEKSPPTILNLQREEWIDQDASLRNNNHCILPKIDSIDNFRIWHIFDFTYLFSLTFCLCLFCQDIGFPWFFSDFILIRSKSFIFYRLLKHWWLSLFICLITNVYKDKHDQITLPFLIFFILTFLSWLKIFCVLSDYCS